MCWKDPSSWTTKDILVVYLQLTLLKFFIWFFFSVRKKRRGRVGPGTRERAGGSHRAKARARDEVQVEPYLVSTTLETNTRNQY